MIVLSQDIDNAQRSTRREVERSAVATLLQQYFGHRVERGVREHGQPYLRDYPHLHMSVSHSLGRVVVALSEEPIGIDLERYDERILRIVPRILPEDAQHYLESCPLGIRVAMAHIFWTSSEALYKLVGDSELISDFYYELSSIIYQSDEGRFALTARYKNAPEAILTLQGRFEGDYVLTFARWAIVP